MSTLTANQRKALPKTAFAGPVRSYPVNDRAHAANAKARASQQYKAGRLSKSQRDRIDSRANTVLSR